MTDCEEERVDMDPSTWWSMIFRNTRENNTACIIRRVAWPERDHGRASRFTHVT